MTVTADLATEIGTKRRLFLKIDGFEPVLWQRHQPTDSSGYETPGYFPRSSDLVGLWLFDEYAGTSDVVDYGPNGLDATAYGPPDVVAGIIRKARDFNSSGRYCCTANSSTTKGQTFTIAIRCNATITSGDHTLIEEKNAAGVAWSIGVRTSDNHLIATLNFDDASSLTVDGGEYLGALTGYLTIGLTWDGTTANLYFAGNKTGTGTAAGKTIDYDTGGIYFGASNADTSATNWPGAIDAAAYYSSVKDKTWFYRAQEAVSWSRSGLVCLRAPTGEYSDGLDLAEQVVSPSSMSFSLDNIEDQDDAGKKYFAKMFAPAKWNNVAHTWLVRPPGTTDTQLNANATTIYGASVGALNTGTAYIGGEAFEYTGKGTGCFTGVTKGMWPCVTGAAYGKTYQYTDDAEVTNVYISEEPYSWVGRRVALYVTTWDADTNYWLAETSAQLLWVGRLTDKIVYSPSECAWQLSCESLLKDLDKTIGADFPQTELSGINLDLTSLHAKGITFGWLWMDEDPDDPSVTWITEEWLCQIIVSQKKYESFDEFAAEIASKINSTASWSHKVAGVTTYVKPTNLGLVQVDLDVISIGFKKAVTGTPLGWRPDKCYIRGYANKRTDDTLIATIMGWGELYKNKESFGKPLDEFWYVDEDWNQYGWTWKSDRPFLTFQCLDTSLCATMYGEKIDKFWSTQGDYSSALAFANITNTFDANLNETGSALVAYTAKTVSTGKFTLSNRAESFYYNKNAKYCGTRNDNNPQAVKIKQVFVPSGNYASGDPTGSNNMRGPFAVLLFPLISSGTTNYLSSTYDKCPFVFSIGIPASLVNVATFLAADRAIMSTRSVDLWNRTGYVVGQPIKWIELLQREGKLFGYFVAWVNGQITLRSAVHPEVNASMSSLGDGNNAAIDERPESSYGVDTVINQWKIKIDYDVQEDKYGPEIIVSDVGSIGGLYVTKSVTLEHPGVMIGRQKNADSVVEIVANALRNTMELYRYPCPIVEVSLAPTLLNKIYVGDVVSWTSNHHPDPFGTGAMTTTCKALVINTSWALDRFIGRATLLLMPNADKPPWAGSALVNIAATNGGWDAANYRLTLVTRTFTDSSSASDDGAVFAATDVIRIIERAPSNPASAQTWTATVASAYETDGANILTLVNGTTLTGWDADKEYIVVPADYASCTATQTGSGGDMDDANAFQADQFTAKLNTTDNAQRWG